MNIKVTLKIFRNNPSTHHALRHLQVWYTQHESNIQYEILLLHSSSNSLDQKSQISSSENYKKSCSPHECFYDFSVLQHNYRDVWA